MPKEARELASFFALIIDTPTKVIPKGCKQLISVALKRSIRELQGLKYCLQMAFIGCVQDVRTKAE